MKRTLLFMLLVPVAALLGACAKIVAPTGGPKDDTPPKQQKEEPANGSVNFTGSVIKISFDEFFSLNNPTENILFSPPLEQQPSYTVQNKTLVIKFKDTLRANTTYNVVFSNCIQDYHESNKLNYYHYSFSTGSDIDTFTLSGVVRDARTLAPSDNFFVFLYDRDVDSLPLSSLPLYLTKTQPDGTFHFQNIRAGSYKVFALKDGNGNLLYDLPNEAVAFGDHPYEAHVTPPRDTSAHAPSGGDTARKVALFSFVAADSVPVLMHYDNPAPGQYIFPYKAPVTQFEATPLDRDIPHFERTNRRRDTLTWYLKGPLTDTVTYLFLADGKADTVLITPYKSKKSQPRGAKTAQAERMPVSILNKGHRFKPLTLVFPYPIRPSDSVEVARVTHHKSGADTSRFLLSVPDTLLTQLPLPLTFEDKGNYSVLIADSVFFGYHGLTNDSLRIDFVTQSEKDYGSLTMEYVLPDGDSPYIAQLWNGTLLLQEDVLTTSQTITYPHLDPGNYSILVVEDTNGNGLWDTGDYHSKRQPETIHKFPKSIHIRAYWETEETFTIPVIRN